MNENIQQQAQQAQQAQPSQQEVDLSQIGGLKSEIPKQVIEPAKPIITNEQFVNLVAPIVYDAACGDLPMEYLAHLPNPAILKAVLDIIDFESATGLLAGGIDLDPKKRLFVGLGATAAWAAFVVVKAQSIKKSLMRRGQYEEEMKKAAQEKQEGYKQLYEEMKEKHGTESGNADHDTGS